MTIITLHHLCFCFGPRYFSLGAALPQKNTLVQNNHLRFHTMTSKKMVGSYYCLIWIGVIQCLQVSYVSEKQNKTKKQTKNKTKHSVYFSPNLQWTCAIMVQSYFQDNKKTSKIVNMFVIILCSIVEQP